jgi:hypothetical protein
MPKKSSKLNAILNTGIITIISAVHVYCTVCDQKLVKHVPNIRHHLQTPKHLRNKKIKNNFKNDENSAQDFYIDLIIILIMCNIPFNVINNKWFRDFIAKYCGRQLPNESLLRKKYFPQIFDKFIKLIRNYINGKDLYFILNEARDLYRYI